VQVVVWGCINEREEDIMGRLFDGPGIWVILVVVLLLFGATRLPALARSLGQSTKIFRQEIKSDAPTSQVAEPAAPVAADPAATVAQPAEPAAPTKPATSGQPGESAKP
jgi:sec-independent protein translocase protein TatA